MFVLSLKNVSFKYPHSEKRAVDDVSLKIKKGSYTAIVGNNGSGKSTLARIICGLEDVESGSVEIDKTALIGLIFQNPKNQIISGVVSRDTAIGPQNLGLDKAETELRVIESLNIVDMLDRAESSTMALSLGQMQKVALSGIIALRPNFLILDEPLSMLDPVSRTEIYDFLDYWHKRGNTILHITHDKDAIERAENIVRMVNGRITFDGAKEDFLWSEDFHQGVMGGGKTLARKIALAFKNVSFTYDEKLVLNDISFAVPEKSLVALTGPSGCGKSTILELASGLLKPSEWIAGKKPSPSNKIAMADENVGASGRFESEDGSNVDNSGTYVSEGGTNVDNSGLYVSEGGTNVDNVEIYVSEDGSNVDNGGIFAFGKIALCQQNAAGALFETFAADDVAFGPRNQGKKGKELVSLVKNAMEKAALPYTDFGERRSFELSGGEQRRLAIAGIIALDTPIILFDEPTAGLDESSRKSILQMLRDLADEGKTVVFSTHKMDETEIADFEIKILNGEVVGGGKCTVFAAESAVGMDNVADSGNSDVSDIKFGTQLKRIEPLSSCKTLEGLRKVSSAFNKKATKNSFVANWHPLLKLVVFLTLFVLDLLPRKIWLCGIMFAVSFGYCALTKFSVKRLLLMMLKITPFLLIFTVFQLFFKQSIWFCIATYLRTLGAVSIISGFFYSTPDYDLIDGLSMLLKPLAVIKIPVRYFVLIIEIMFRFIPLLIDEATSIIKTQSIRGGLGDAKGLFAKVRSLIPLFVPLIAQTIKRAEALADALAIRCFNKAELADGDS